MNSRILVLVMMLITVPGAALGASVYKWTDENGVTHFGDRQPQGRQAESVSVRTGKSSGGQQSSSSPQEQLEQMQQRQGSEEQQQRESAVEEARRKQREANCETARSNLKIIQSNARIRVEENGEQRYLTPEEIEEKKTQFQEIADENCGEPAPEQQ